MRGDGIHPYERRQLEAALLASQQLAQAASSAPSTIYPTLHGTFDNSSSAPAHSRTANTSDSIGSFSSASRVAPLQQQQQSKPLSFSDIQSFSDERTTIEVGMSVQQQQETDLDMVVGDSDGEGGENQDLSGQSLPAHKPALPGDSSTILESTSSRSNPPDRGAATSNSNSNSNTTDPIVAASTSASKRPRANSSTFAGIELPAAVPKGKDKTVVSTLGKKSKPSSNHSSNFKSTEFVQSSDDDSVARSSLAAPAKKARRSSTATTTTSKTSKSGAANENGHDSPLTDYDEPMPHVPANRSSSTKSRPKPRRTPSVVPTVLDEEQLELSSSSVNQPAQPLPSDEPTASIFGVALPALPSAHSRSPSASTSVASTSVASTSTVPQKPKRVVEAVSEDGAFEENLLAEIDAMNEYMEDQDSDFGGGGKKQKGKGKEKKGKKEKVKRPPRRRPSTIKKAETVEAQPEPEPDEGTLGKEQEPKRKREKAEKKKDGEEQAEEEHVPVVENAVDEPAPQPDHDDEEDDEIILRTSGASNKKHKKKQAAPVVHDSEDEDLGGHTTPAEVDDDVGGVRRSPRVNKGVAKVWDDEDEGGGASAKKAAVAQPAAKGKGRKKFVAPSSEAEQNDHEQDLQLDEGDDDELDMLANRKSKAKEKAKDRGKKPASPKPTSVSPALSRNPSSRSDEAKRRMDLVMQAAAETDGSFWPSPDKPNAKGKGKEKERDAGDADDEDDEEKEEAEPKSGSKSDHTKENDGSKIKPVTPAAGASTSAARPRDRSTTPFSKTPKPGSLAAIMQKRGLATFRAPGLSSRTKIPPLHVNLKPPPPAKKTLVTDRPKPKKKKGDESYSDEDKPWYERKDPEEWDDDDHARWARRMRRIDRGLPADSDHDD
ncbi:hypothetical protein JCM1840_003335 [Sporobolomyces johnsonii]